MDIIAFQTPFYYLWWILLNGFIFYAEFNFILRLSDIPSHYKNLRFLYVFVNCTLTFLALYLRMPILLRETLHMALICLLPSAMGRRSISQITAPAIIIFTLITFMDGISAVVMTILVSIIPNPILGNLAQIALGALLALSLYAALQVIAKQWRTISRQAFTSYLCILLLPCSYVVWVIRFGLGLNNSILTLDTSLLARGFPWWALVSLAGALATFIVVLFVFEKIATLSSQETERALLDAKMRELSIYLSEAKKRSEEYRSFQHDIHNHLLILSGLLKEKKYSRAEKYFAKLSVSSNTLISQFSTGNSVLDILLSEKIQYAKQKDIQISHDILLPENMLIEDVDLCIIFSNAMDNAICACLKEEQKNRHISINASTRHEFLLIEITNSPHTPGIILPSTGLKNIKYTAEKYEGTAEYRQEQGSFRLSVLLCCKLKASVQIPIAKPELPFAQ